MGICSGMSFLLDPSSWLGLGNLQALFNLFYSQKIDRHVEDRMCWVPTRSGFFEVQLYYRALTNGGVHSFPWRNIWMVKVPKNGLFHLGCYHGKRSLLWIIWEKGIFLLSINVVCARIVPSLWIIYLTIGHKWVGYGLSSYLFAISWVMPKHVVEFNTGVSNKEPTNPTTLVVLQSQIKESYRLKESSIFPWWWA